MHVLLVEDDLALVQTLARSMAAGGMSVISCSDGAEALTLARKRLFDVIVLDLGLPGLDGLELLRRLRTSDNFTPVLILTARGAVGERVAGLQAGADDYLPKPFDLDELMARTQAVARRRNASGDWRCGRLRCERTQGTVWCDERPLDLPPREAALLQALIQRAGHAVPRQRLHEAVFADESVGSEALDVVLHRLRRRLAQAQVEIVTLRGVGCVMLEAAPAIAASLADGASLAEGR
ncbi:MAG: response regulator transcription factor [Rubrivivax sp.]|jgi:DNA-binding response OmpR family regulator|nr:response regulator transcription factor [Rubrivivax sp.]